MEPNAYAHVYALRGARDGLAKLQSALASANANTATAPCENAAAVTPHPLRADACRMIEEAAALLGEVEGKVRVSMGSGGGKSW